MSSSTTRSSQRPGTKRVAPSSARRQARLRPEHASTYPGIETGVWESAAVLCDRVIASELLRGSPVDWRERALPPEHFEFRGGDGLAQRPRREDR
jgi:hypothetical protein